MKRSFIIVCLALFVVGVSTLALTDQQAAELASRFVPPAVKKIAGPLYEDAYAQDALSEPLQQIQFNDGYLRYLAFSMPGSPNLYLLLGWASTDRTVYWRLLVSRDGGKTYTVAQDAPYWIGVGDSNGFHMRLADLTGDGVPEILFAGNSGNSLFVYAWRDGQMVSITPLDPEMTSLDTRIREGFSMFRSSQGVGIEDLNGDGVAEVVVNADFTNEPDDEGDYTSKPVSPTQIYRYNGTKYVLSKTIPYSDSNPFPVNVPSLGVVHPGTIPLSELQENSGNGDLQVFVSQPAAGGSVDELVTDSYRYNSTPLTFVKRWANKKRPNRSSANQELMANAVTRVPAQAKGDWNPSPEDPWLPSPDGKTENHFVGPYLEFRLPKKAVFPDLLQKAQDYFAKNPAKMLDYEDVQLTGKTKDGRISVVDAMVVIKKTGEAKKGGGKK